MKKSTLIAVALLASSILSAESVTTTQYLKVIKSTPVYGEAQPCVDGVAQPSSTGTVGGIGKDTIGTLAGGAIGGLLGTQVGSGRGKTVATIGGALLGAMAGKTAASNYGNAPTAQAVKCNTTAQGTKVIAGYTNTAHLNGKEIQVQSDQPLTQIPVTVTYSY